MTIDSSRPLPEEYLRYAREDTHYLLYIYDLLRNRLLEVRNKNPQLLQSVYAKSKMICQKVICYSLCPPVIHCGLLFSLAVQETLLR